jgi:hypothetical protein
VTIELLVVPVGAIAVTFAVAVTPGNAGKVTVADWPTVTEARSASATLAETVMDDTFAIVTNPVLVEVDVEPDVEVEVEDAPEVVDEADPLDDALLDCPTVPFTAVTRPAIGAVSFASLTSC